MVHVIWDATCALTAVAASYRQIEPLSVYGRSLLVATAAGEEGGASFRAGICTKGQLIGLMIRLPASVTEKQLPAVLYSPATARKTDTSRWNAARFDAGDGSLDQTLRLVPSQPLLKKWRR